MNSQDLSKRFISSLVSLVVLGAILTFSTVGIVKWVIALFTSGLGSLGIWEYCRLAKIGKKRGMNEICMIIGAVLILAFFISSFDPSFSHLPFMIAFIGVISLFLFHFDKISGAIGSIGMGVFGIFYVAIPLGLILKILYYSPPHNEGGMGRMWLVYLLVVTKITDVGAYFGGRLLGNRKLAAKLSPKKTIAGSIIGFFSAILFSFLFYLLGNGVMHFSISFAECLWLGALLGLMGQVGDLSESLFKRDAAVKDSNRLPGLGGILDLLDSLLFTTPVVYFFLYAV